MHHYGFALEDAELAIHFVAEECYSHEEFVKYLKKKPPMESYEKPLDLAS
jgi:hypothetical protein